jgi:broad specificity phosphatase PhoE
VRFMSDMSAWDRNAGARGERAADQPSQRTGEGGAVPDEEGVKRPGARLTLLAHPPTAATTAAAFPVDEALDDRGRTWAREARGRVPRVDRVVTAPERACRETCEILGVPASVDAGIQGWDLGTWAGRTLEEISGRQPDDVAVWLADPRSAPHGGESLAGLIGRVRAWLGRASAGHTLAVCSPAVARACLRPRELPSSPSPGSSTGGTAAVRVLRAGVGP